MAKRKSNALHPSKAVRLVEILIAEGKIIARDIERYLEIDDLEDRLKALRGGGELPVPHARANTAKSKKRVKKAVSAKVAATRRIQGQYIAHLRKFPKTARGKFQQIARTESRE